MSRKVLEEVIERASSDARFRESLQSNFEAAIRSYDLTPDEKAELAKGLGAQSEATAEGMPSAMAASEASEAMASSEASTTEQATTDLLSASDN